MDFLLSLFLLNFILATISHKFKFLNHVMVLILITICVIIFYRMLSIDINALIALGIIGILGYTVWKTK